MQRSIAVMRESFGKPSFNWMTQPTDDMTTQFRIAQLEQGFRDFKAEWSVDVREIKATIAVTQATMGSGLTAIQTQLAAMQVRDEQWKNLDVRLSNIEKIAPDSLNGRVKAIEERSWQVVLAILVGAAGLVWTALETVGRLPVKIP